MKTLRIALVTIICLTFISLEASAVEFHTAAKQAFMIDAETGMVLFEKNAQERMPTSSMSKAMSIYMVFEALKDGRLSLDTELLVSEKAWRKGGSKMFVEVNKRVAVEDLIQGVIVQSGNDATIVLAEGLAGSEEAFAEALNRKAKELGMDNSHFINASGWPDPEHYSTAEDLAKLGMHLVKDFSDYYHYFSETEYTYSDITQKNRNPLLYRDMGADGIKTGHTEAGGYGLMASAERNGRRVVLVVNGLESEKARAQESARLLEWGLRGFENVNLFEKDKAIEYADVVMGKEKQVPLVLDQPVFVTVPALAKDAVKFNVSFNGTLTAPVNAGAEVGKLHINIPDIGDITRPLFAANDVEQQGFFARTITKIGLMIKGE